MIKTTAASTPPAWHIAAESVDPANSLFRAKAEENLVALETARYGCDNPLIIKGAVAGL